MNKERLKFEDFKGGWLVGSFVPNLFNRKDVEVGVKYLEEGFIDEAHFHKLSTEFNLVIYGKIKLESGETVSKGDFFIYKPNQISKTKVLESSCVLVIRDSSHPDDKYLENDSL